MLGMAPIQMQINNSWNTDCVVKVAGSRFEIATILKAGRKNVTNRI